MVSPISNERVTVVRSVGSYQRCWLLKVRIQIFIITRIFSMSTGGTKTLNRTDKVVFIIIVFIKLHRAGVKFFLNAIACANREKRICLVSKSLQLEQSHRATFMRSAVHHSCRVELSRRSKV